MAPKTTKLAIRPNDQEQVWGIVYMLFSILMLPTLLRLFNGLLPVPLGNTWFNFLYFSCNFLFVVWIFHGFLQRCMVHAGKYPWRFLGAVCIGIAAYWALNYLTALVLEGISKDYVNLNDSTIQTMVQGNFPIMALGTALLVPVAEETLHRGLVFGSLYPKNHCMAYVISAAVFSAVHIIGYIGIYDPLHLLMAFIQYVPAGLVLAWAYRFSGSIFAPIIIHATINTIGLLTVR